MMNRRTHGVADVDEFVSEALAAASIHRLPIPTPFRGVGPVNAYLLEGSP